MSNHRGLQGLVGLAVLTLVATPGVPNGARAQQVGTTKAVASSPFAGMRGSWTGAGTVTASDGTTERIRCRVSYITSIALDTLRQSMRCASASYAFDISTDIATTADGIVGRWAEATRNVSGDFSGRALGDRIEGQVMGFGFSIGLAVVTRGDQQAISIRAAGAKFTDVAINLKKDGP